MRIEGSIYWLIPTGTLVPFILLLELCNPGFEQSKVVLALPVRRVAPALLAKVRLAAPAEGERLVCREVVTTTILRRILEESWPAVMMECFGV